MICFIFFRVLSFMPYFVFFTHWCTVHQNKKLFLNHEWNVKLESGQIVTQRIPGVILPESAYSELYERSDLALMFSRKINLNNKVAIGYMARHTTASWIHRFTQQYSFVRGFKGYLLSHRIRFEQESDDLKKFNYRLRYRLSNLFPFQGASLDPKEWYLRNNLEFLARSRNEIFKTPLQYELRFVPMIGYQFNSDNRLEFGLDYRHARFPADLVRNDFWLSVNWYFAKR